MSDFPHGTTYGYRKGCRCAPCKNAKKLDWQEYKARQAEADDGDLGRMDEPDQVSAIVADLVLKVRCEECGQWHEAAELECPRKLRCDCGQTHLEIEDDPSFQCPQGALMPLSPNPGVQ